MYTGFYIEIDNNEYDKLINNKISHIQGSISIENKSYIYLIEYISKTDRLSISIITDSLQREIISKVCINAKSLFIPISFEKENKTYVYKIIFKQFDKKDEISRFEELFKEEIPCSEISKSIHYFDFQDDLELLESCVLFANYYIKFNSREMQNLKEFLKEKFKYWGYDDIYNFYSSRNAVISQINIFLENDDSSYLKYVFDLFKHHLDISYN